MASVFVLVGLLVAVVTIRDETDGETGGDRSPASATLGAGSNPSPSPTHVAPSGGPSERSAGRGVFSTPSRARLLFSDGVGGGVILDVDTMTWSPVNLPDRAGDQPFRLHRVGAHVVMGWGQIHALSFGSGALSRRLPDATLYVPGSDDRTVWLVDYPGSRLGRGQGTWRLVEVASGEVLHEAPAPADAATVERGVPGGLAYRDPGGVLRRHDVDTGLSSDFLGGDATLLAVDGDLVVWCRPGCAWLEVLTGDGGASVSIGGSAVASFHPRNVWLSAASGRVVALADVRVGSATQPELRVHELDRTGGLVSSRPVPTGRLMGAWSVDGRRFFYRIHDPKAVGDAAPHILGRYVPGDGFEQLHGIELPERLVDLAVLPASDR